jgi:peptide-methionine (S)-S-oxide reductase
MPSDDVADADPSFRAAVAAIHAGDCAALARLLDAEPRLVRDRCEFAGADAGAAQPEYFRAPKLIWFVANNPVLVRPMAGNIVDIARVMLERGVETADLDYALELTMSGSAAREQGLQRPLMHVLRAAGATATPRAVAGAGAHRELDALRALLEAGHPMTAPIAAALGDAGALPRLLAEADRDEIQMAFALAVINGNVPAAVLALDAGAEIDAFLPVHAHSTALHQAVDRDDAALVGLLLGRGARTDMRDTIWNGTPLDWASYLGRSASRTVLLA